MKFKPANMPSLLQPTEVAATIMNRKVIITWKCLERVHITRNGIQLTPHPVSGPEFVDVDPPLNQQLIYRVFAADRYKTSTSNEVVVKVY